MLGIVSKKKYDELLKENLELGNNNEIMTFEFDRLNSELKNKKRIAFDLNGELLEERRKVAMLEKELENQKKMVQKLKALCTKNGVDYKHLIRKEK